MESKATTAANHLRGLTLRALLVDDEMGAINALRNMLQEYCPQVEICGIASSVQEAVSAAAAIQPDVVFLDIQMPPLGSGFDFLQQFPEPGFGVIFTTAYPKYAIQAINTIQPWAYLVKPYSVSELKKAVAVAADKVYEKNKREGQAKSLIIQDSRKGTVVIRLDHIVFCRAAGSFTEIHVFRAGKVEKITTSRNLGEYDNELADPRFCRTHHSYLVNLNYVQRFERTGRNGIVHLNPPGYLARVSVAKMDEFISALEHFSQLAG
ncbi:MAG: LytTR family DNA-binding domain-containing protein [Saprospiraceae bacterium]|nr:response regulator transcription factor [Lewinellaceae bacterium]